MYHVILVHHNHKFIWLLDLTSNQDLCWGQIVVAPLNIPGPLAYSAVITRSSSAPTSRTFTNLQRQPIDIGLNEVFLAPNIHSRSKPLKTDNAILWFVISQNTCTAVSIKFKY